MLAVAAGFSNVVMGMTSRGIRSGLVWVWGGDLIKTCFGGLPETCSPFEDHILVSFQSHFSGFL